jgi:hypothetical protein
MAPPGTPADDADCWVAGAKVEAGDRLNVFQPANANAVSNRRAAKRSNLAIRPVRSKFKRPPVADQCGADAVRQSSQ